MNIINLTQHKIDIHSESGVLVMSVPPSGKEARVSTTREKVGEMMGFSIYKTVPGAPKGLPDPQPDTIFVVSGVFRSCVNKRQDVYQPGELLRNKDGNPIGCIGLSQ